MPDGQRPESRVPVSRHARLKVLQTGLSWFGSGSGGLDRVFSDMARSLPLHDVEISGFVVSPPEVSALTNGIMQPFAPEGAGFARRLISARARIGALADARAFDVIAPHFALHVATALDRLRDFPMVVHFHGPWASESRVEGTGRLAAALKHGLELAVYRRADRLIVLSEAFGHLLTQQFAVSAERIRVVPGAVALDRYAGEIDRKQARALLGWPCDRPIALSVRRLATRMGLEMLIDAMKDIVRRVPEAMLFIAGKGNLEAALRQRVAAFGLDPHVRFLGFVSDANLVLAYAAADLHIMPSQALEGFGLSAAEALAAGTPSMVTPVGGLPEVVGGLSGDLVLPDCSSPAIAAGVTAALLAPGSLPSAGACRAYAAQHFQVERAARQTAAIYREALAG